ncbi:ATP-grasp domain-containing protein [Bacteroidales bacterium OttesenSCG-928-A17]|nr:ATP-grasp domain-containing protein [Bacteroidales bacterium OttesenSCG-928-A17]
MNILFTCAGRRNYLINYFKQALNGNGTVFAADMQLTAPALVDADVAIQVPGIYDNAYIPALIESIKKHKIDAIISLNDLELPILSANRKEIETTGVKLIVSGEGVIDIAFDKKKTADFLISLGLKTPKTYTVWEEAVDAINRNELSFPVVVKPRWGSASIGIDFPKDMEELNLSYRLQKKRLKETILSKASEDDIDHAILIQEKIPGKEYGMDVLNDFEGNYVGTFVREKLAMRAGETDKAVSVVDERFEKLGRMIGENLKHIGNLDCDVFLSDDELYVLELNPRFGGGYPFSHEAGVNTPAIYIEWLKGNKDISRHINYKEGVMFSKCDRLLRIS